MAKGSGTVAVMPCFLTLFWFGGEYVMVDDKLDLLAISLPPGSGKSTLAIFLLTFLAGRDPNNPILTGSHSNAFVRGCYDEVLRALDPKGEYLFHDVFPSIKVSGTNAKDCRIDLDKRQRFETLEFTSIGTGIAVKNLFCDSARGFFLCL